MIRLSPTLRLIVITSLIRLAFAATTGLGVDESYMVTAGRALSLGYFDHPPAAWWLSWGAAHVFGTEAAWAVRLPFILLFALSQYLVWRIACVVADPRAGFWAAMLLNLSPVFGVTTGTWVLPDGPLDAALLGSALCLVRALPGNKRAAWWWAGAGVCGGLALFSKYSAVLTMGGAFLYLAVSPEHRRWLRRPEPYLAGMMTLLVFSPVLIWNATHGWASFVFQGERALGLRFRPLLPLQTLGGEALFVLPWIWVPLMILWVQGFRRGAGWPHRLLAWLAAPPIVVFALISAWSTQRVLYHWAAPGYLMLYPLLGGALAARVDEIWVRRVVAGTTALVLVSVAVVAMDLQFDWLGQALSGVMRRDPTAEGVDWTSLGTELKARGLLPPGQVVAALNWRDAGKIGRGLGPETTMLCLSPDSRQFGFAEPPDRFKGADMLVLVAEPVSPREQMADNRFRHVEMLAPATVRLNGRVLQRVVVLRGIGLR